MSDRRLEQIRARLVRRLRSDPPASGSPLALDRWVLAHLSREEIDVIVRADREYGGAAMSEWFGEALVEAGLSARALPLAG